MSGLRDLEPKMHTAGVSRMVYAIPWPETRKIRDELWSDHPHRLYSEPCSKKQDGTHIELGELWKDWARPCLKFDRSVLRSFHVSNGSSEAIREIIAQFSIDSWRTCQQGRLHTFEGEYEGYEICAENYGLHVFSHSRNPELYMQSLESAVVDD